ncbi:hypothetical protein GCM10018965_029550 [Nonomuraea roseola]
MTHRLRCRTGLGGVGTSGRPSCSRRSQTRWGSAQTGAPRERPHSSVSLLSDPAVPLKEEIAQLAGHSGTAVAEVVYRKQTRPVLLGGAGVMDEIFTR